MSHWLAPDAQAESARARRRKYPVHVYVGKNGSGKSLTAVYDTLPTLEEGRPVLSTVRLLNYLNPAPCDGLQHGPTNVYGERPVPCPITDPHTGEHLDDGHGQAHPLYLRFTYWEQFLRFRAGDILMDEITGVADSSEHAGMPSEVKDKLSQLRRADVSIRATGLSWSRVNKRVREATFAVTRCRGMAPVPANSDYGKGRIFRPNRMSLAGTYNAHDLSTDEITKTQFEKAKCLGRGRLWIPNSVAISAYDSLGSVDAVGHSDISGICTVCSGTRRRPACECPGYKAELARRKEVAGAAASVAAAESGTSPAGLLTLDPVARISGTCACGTIGEDHRHAAETITFPAVSL